MLKLIVEHLPVPMHMYLKWHGPECETSFLPVNLPLKIRWTCLKSRKCLACLLCQSKLKNDAVDPVEIF